jgi:glycosyltransferase involved in cell wall biosynthesis
MKVLLDSRPAADLGGVGRYSRCLLAALRETASPGDEALDSNRPSRAVRARGLDVFHSPWMDGAMLHSPCAMVVTIHDLTAVKRRSEHLRGSLRMRLRPLAVQRAARVIVPTTTVAEDAIEYLQLEPQRVAVIAEAADASMYRRTPAEIAVARERFGLPERYLVWVGRLQHPDPSRHVAKLAAAPRKMPLVLVGATRPWAHELPDVILTGQVGDDELGALYSGAHALVISSDQEGFGLPAVEALACGTPVAATDGPALREVLGERATFVPPGDMPALLDAAQNASRPAPRPPSFTWEDAARATWAVYSGAMADSGRVHSSSARHLRRARGADVRAAWRHVERGL